MAMTQGQRRLGLQVLGVVLILSAIALEVAAVRSLQPATAVVTERITDVGLEYHVVQAERTASIPALVGFGLVVAVAAVRLITYMPEDAPLSLAIAAETEDETQTRRAA